jgi:CHAT domain
LKGLAERGPIVLFNVSDIRTDAFIVTLNDINVIPLPLLTNTALQRFTERFLSAIETQSLKHRASSRSEIHEVLKWIWDVAAGPILDKIGFLQCTGGNSTWPRVWWVGSGLLNVLPIHAAGYHELGSTRSVIDCVISSYTPTIKALAYARERSVRSRSATSQRAMLVGMLDTPEQNKLPSVVTEINGLENLLSSCIHTTVIQNPTRENVLSALPHHQIVHFSCHSYSSLTNPSLSKLLLHDWKESPLTVSDLTTLNVQLPQLAFLATCHSASSRDFHLLSESITLSSAIQLAGYPSVIGTLWTVADQYAPEIVNTVYARMLVGRKLETDRCAESLHHAIRTLRHRSRQVLMPGISRIVPDDPLVWALYSRRHINWFTLQLF